MVESTNYNRNMKSDEWQLKSLRRNSSLYRTFTSKEYRTLWGFLQPNRRSLFVIVGLSFGTAVLEGAKTILQVGLIKGIVASDSGVKALLNFQLFGRHFSLEWFGSLNTRLGLLAVLFGGLMALTLAASAVKFANAWLSKRVQLDLTRDVRNKTLDKIFSLDLKYFDQAKSGELIFLMNAETSRFANLVTYAERFLTYSIQIAIFVSLLFYTSWDMTAVILAVSGIYFWLHLPLDKRAKLKSMESNMAQNRLSHLFHQIVYGIKIIKIGCCEKREQDQFLHDHRTYEREDLWLTKLNNLSVMLREFASAAILFLIVAYIHVFKDMSAVLKSPDQILAYLFLLVRTIPAVAALQDARNTMIGAYGPLSRVMALLHDTSMTVPPALDGTAEKVVEVRDLTVRRVCFSYHPQKAVLDNIELGFERDRIYAFVGPSGSGKSTLLDVLASVRHPASGGLEVNQQPLETLDVSSYKRLVGYMNQEPIMFHDHILKNVTYFRPNASRDEIWDALKLAAVDDFIKTLPQGLGTGLGERGLTVSGGQRQRIGLARIFLQNTPILLLDEATNALDYRTEELIYNNLKSLQKGRIIIVAAHRLSTLKDFDKIIVLSKGRVVEQGTHAELMANKSLYHDLFIIQERGLDYKPVAEKDEATP
jgi:ABC-type multidrug transport system fused ATPase/permease subunit